MKFKTTVIFLVLVVGATAALGAFGFMNMEHGLGIFCPLASVAGLDCSNGHNALAMTMHHIDGLLYFAQALVAVFILLVAFSVFTFFEYQKEVLLSKSFYFYLKRNIDGMTYFSRKVLRWIILQNKVDSHTLARQGVL